MKLQDLKVLDLASDPREGLGDKVPFFFYRYLSLFAVADSTGTTAPAALYQAGMRIGQQLVEGMQFRSFDEIVQHYKDHGLGLLHYTLPSGSAETQVTIAECATCSGLPPVDAPLCFMDAGMIAGAMSALSASKTAYTVEETECVGLGDSACVFTVRTRT